MWRRLAGLCDPLQFPASFAYGNGRTVVRALCIQGQPADEFPSERIRNFSIVAHVDHGKSTLADRLLELTGVVPVCPDNKQLLDRLPVERERGITVKAQTATMFHRPLHTAKTHMLNLIDTPGHVDFSYEVSRSLAACQGVILVVDAQQGVQAQTVANFLLASEAGLDMIPVINKIDLKKAEIPQTIEQMSSAFGFREDEILQVSAKIGTGVSDILTAVVDKVSSPPGNRNGPLCLLLFDSWFDRFRGVVCLVAVREGVLKVGAEVMSCHTGRSYEVAELGLLQPGQVPQDKLVSGQVGYVILGMKSSKEARIGDTLHHPHLPVNPLPGFKPAKSMVFAGIYPLDQSDVTNLRLAIDRLTLNDSSVSVEVESSTALGQGWRIGFLGLLHLEVFTQRLEEEFKASVLVTTPSVPYKAITQKGKEIDILSPAQFPEGERVQEFLEPVVMGTLVFPEQYLGKLLKLCEERRGKQQNLLYLDSSRVLLKYKLPLSEVVVDFFDQVKSLSSGYASFDYEEVGYQQVKLVKLNFLLNGVSVDALAMVVNADNAYTIGRTVCQKLKNNIHRQLFEVAIQAAIGGKIIARETVKALRKDVTAKCYGGDISRKMKLLSRQREGKKKMKQIGNVELDRKAFLSILERN